MEKHNQTAMNESALDDDIIEMLAEAQEPAPIPVELAARMRENLIQNISQENASQQEGFSTLRSTDGEWVEVMPGAQFKVLHDDGNGLDGLLSYLIKLDAGFEMQGHGHPFDEECLMLEGDLTLGDITLNKGDFHYAAAGVTHGHVSSANGCMAFIRGALPI
jgi:quercetin dioxygenase-like cupin family protein